MRQEFPYEMPYYEGFPQRVFFLKMCPELLLPLLTRLGPRKCLYSFSTLVQSRCRVLLLLTLTQLHLDCSSQATACETFTSNVRDISLRVPCNLISWLPGYACGRGCLSTATTLAKQWKYMMAWIPFSTCFRTDTSVPCPYLNIFFFWQKYPWKFQPCSPAEETTGVACSLSAITVSSPSQ